MAYKPAIAVYDACVLYPFHTRNLLVQCGVDRLVDPRWSDEIHDEWIRNLLKNNPGLDPGRFDNTRALMEKALPHASVKNYQQHQSKFTLPDAKDHHVVAAGLEAGAAQIVTWNLSDFPSAALAPLGIAAISPDALMTSLHTAVPELTLEVAHRAHGNLTKSGMSKAEFIAALRNQKLSAFADILDANGHV